ncbi:MAG: phytanoyl-CoA dioxygenase family protein [Gammaproteobacteria bacterium]
MENAKDSIRGPLTDEQVESFRREGFVIVPGLFSANQIAKISTWSDEVHDWPELPGKYMMYFEHTEDNPPKRLLNRIEDVLPYHEEFRKLAISELMQGACGQLFGEPATLFKDKINYKLPGGGGFASHQDVQAGWSRYAELHITALITIDRTTIENGCLEMCGGCHNMGLLGEEWTPLDDQGLGGVNYVAVESEPGDAVFFDSFTPHRSEPNRTDDPRRVLYYTYNKVSAGDHLRQYYDDKRASYPPDIDRQDDKEYVYRV